MGGTSIVLDLEFQALIGTAKTRVLVQGDLSHLTFQALIGTAKTGVPAGIPLPGAPFQALIGTAKTHRRLIDRGGGDGGFKPS